MEKKKQELGNLYALRAGLSIISQKSDVYDEKYFDLKEEENKLKYHYKYTSESQVNEDYIKTMDKLNNNVYKARQTLLKSENEYKKSRLKFGICLTLGLILTCVGIILYVFSIIMFSNSIVLPYRDFIGFAGLGCIAVSVLIYIFSGKLGTEYISDKNYKKRSIREKQDAEIIYSKESQNAEFLKQKNLAQVKEYEKEKKNYDILLVTTNNHQNLIKQESKNIENVLVKEFSYLLDTRDWENIDLIIYYYETGRADSIKEALQLVDFERRNDELIQSINYASNKICDTIKSSVKVLGEVFVASFDMLSAQMETQRVQIMTSLQQVNENLGGVITQQTLSNALLAKANVSSIDMVEQMKELNK